VATFDERAAGWDTPERQARAETVADAIRATVPLSPTTRAIEIGAGTGLLGLALADDLGELVLAEPSAGMLEVARGKLEARDDDRVSALQFDLLADQPPTPPFDLAISQLVLHHLQDTDRALRAIRDLLRSGGRIALVDLDTEDGTFHTEEAEGIYHLGFDRPDLASRAARAGFADIAFTTAATYHEDGRDYPLFLLTAVRP